MLCYHLYIYIMKAIVVNKWLKGPEELSVSNVDIPTAPKAGELQIEVKSVGLNFFDTLMVKTTFNLMSFNY